VTLALHLHSAEKPSAILLHCSPVLYRSTSKFKISQQCGGSHDAASAISFALHAGGSLLCSLSSCCRKDLPDSQATEFARQLRSQLCCLTDCFCCRNYNLVLSLDKRPRSMDCNTIERYQSLFAGAICHGRAFIICQEVS
jgi:hypothetical protein